MGGGAKSGWNRRGKETDGCGSIGMEEEGKGGGRGRERRGIGGGSVGNRRG